MVPAPQAAFLVAEIVAESRQSRQIIAETLARAVNIRRICVWGRSDVGFQHVAHGKTCELA